MAMQKKSRKRDAILACVCSTDTHPTAEWVYTQLKPDIPDLSLGTVYRNLAMFRVIYTNTNPEPLASNELSVPMYPIHHQPYATYWHAVLHDSPY